MLEFLEIEQELREVNTSLISLRRSRLNGMHNTFLIKKDIEAVKAAFMASESYSAIKGIGNRKEAVVSELKPLRFKLREQEIDLQDWRDKISNKEAERELLILQMEIALMRVKKGL